MRNINTKKGFSLVELLISLIVISCITAAFAPLITKKFSTGVFGGGNSENNSDTTLSCLKFGTECKNCTETECIECNTGYQLNSVPSSANACKKPDAYMQIENLLVTKYNMGDYTELPIPVGVNVVSTGLDCNPSRSNPCCWQGATTSSCDSANGDYSGCNRTVCDWWAADKICKSLTLGGYSWRLPTNSEMSNWGDYSKNLGNDGLQLCDDISGYSSAQCYNSERCPGSYVYDKCIPNFFWSGEIGNSSYPYNYRLSNGSWRNDIFPQEYAFSVRCVADVCSKFEKNCKSCSETSCTVCKAGYELKNGVCKKIVVMQIGNLLATKFNMGDHPDLPVSVPGVTVVSTNTTCNSSSTNPCCWQGETASPCDSANGDYSGCNRTVCDWWAADIICKSLTLGNYTWRLATTSEMSSWATNSKGLGNNGLQLCDYYSGYSSARCNNVYRCPGSNDYCNPRYVWSGDEYNSSNAYYYYLRSGSWNRNWYDRTSAFSVRCVTDLYGCGYPHPALQNVIPNWI